MKSMTGFGRARGETLLGDLVIELQSVNRKYFDLQIYLPKEFTRYEAFLRKEIKTKLSRGSLSLRLFLYPNNKSAAYLFPSEALLQNIKDQWQFLAKELSLSKEITLQQLLDFTKNFPTEQKFSEKILEEEMAKVLREALIKLLKTKEEEGAHLQKEMLSYVQQLEEELQRIQKELPEATKLYEKKILEKLASFITDKELEERGIKEVVQLVDKMDITEEIIRLKTHFIQMRKLFEKDQQPIGREGEFFVQEINREINTISAKSSYLPIIQKVMEMRNLADKIKEQIQNIE